MTSNAAHLATHMRQAELTAATASGASHRAPTTPSVPAAHRLRSALASVSALWLEMDNVQHRLLQFSPGPKATGGRPSAR